MLNVLSARQIAHPGLTIAMKMGGFQYVNDHFINAWLKPSVPIGCIDCIAIGHTPKGAPALVMPNGHLNGIQVV